MSNILKTMAFGVAAAAMTFAPAAFAADRGGFHGGGFHGGGGGGGYHGASGYVGGHNNWGGGYRGGYSGYRGGGYYHGGWGGGVRVYPRYYSRPVFRPYPAFAGRYFCASAGTYYPYVSYCPEGWQLVP